MPPPRSPHSGRDTSLLSSRLFTTPKGSSSSGRKVASRVTAAALGRERDRKLADTMESIAWTAQRLAAEDSTLADERLAWAVQ